MPTKICTQNVWPRAGGVTTGISLALGLWLTASLMATNAFAQNAATPPTAEDPQAVAQAIPATPDAVTNERIQQFALGGLIERQAALSEGLLLVDRQLRQMQLVEQILAAYGPEAQVEIAPGEFRSFRDTPAGMRQEIAHIDLQLQLAEKRAELDQMRGQSTQDGMVMADLGRLMEAAGAAAQTQDGTDTLAQLTAPDTANPAGLSQSATLPEAVALGTLVIEEIYGQLGALKAVVRIAGTRTTVRNNDNLSTGHRVISVGRDRLAVELMDGGLREFEIR